MHRRLRRRVTRTPAARIVASERTTDLGIAAVRAQRPPDSAAVVVDKKDPEASAIGTRHVPKSRAPR